MKIKIKNNKTIFNSYLAGLFEGHIWLPKENTKKNIILDFV
jgi:hypothetical protein